VDVLHLECTAGASFGRGGVRAWAGAA